MTLQPPTVDDVAAALRAGAADQCDPFNTAAVEMLINHGKWLDRPALLDRCDFDQTHTGWWGVIRWHEVTELIEQTPRTEQGPIGSPTSWSMLRLAHDIALDRHQLLSLDAANRRHAGAAFSAVFDAIELAAGAADLWAHPDSPWDAGDSVSHDATGAAASS